MNTPKNPLHAYYKQDPDLRFAVLTPEEERELFARAKGKGPKADEAREFLIENHLLFTAQEARKRAKGHLPDADVVSAGNHALMTCIDRFDASKGARFTTYLRYFIRAKVSELWRERDPVNYKKHFPTDGETDMSFREPLEDNTETPDYGGDEFREKMLEALATVRKDLEPDEQLLLKQVYEEKKSFAEIARAQGVSREAVRTQHLRLLRRLKSSLKPVRKSLE